MREFCPIAVLHADLVSTLPEGRNSRNQRGFQHILSVTDSATHYLWLLSLRHKTADSVVATLFDKVISRVSVPSAILTDRGGKFMGEVVECLLKRLGITHLKTSAYHPQTDAKCDVYISLCTKLVDDKPDLLGTVVLLLLANPHELSYSFSVSCLI